MPYRLRKAPKRNLYWVIGKDGSKLSNNPLPLERAKRQLTAANIASAQEKKGGGLLNDVFNYERVSNEFTNPESVLRKRISDVAKGPRVNYPPSSRQALQKYGNYKITSITLNRKPVLKVFYEAYRLLTQGLWTKKLADENTDNLFHLSIILGLRGDNGQNVMVVVEKREIVVVKLLTDKNLKGTSYRLPQVLRNTTLQQFMDRGLQAIGPQRFFLYDAFRSNCQDFVAALLSANNLYRGEAAKFTKQDVNSLLSQLPGWAATFAKATTDLGGIANIALEGGKLRGGVNLDKLKMFASYCAQQPYMVRRQRGEEGQPQRGLPAGEIPAPRSVSPLTVTHFAAAPQSSCPDSPEGRRGISAAVPPQLQTGSWVGRQTGFYSGQGKMSKFVRGVMALLKN